MDLPEASGDNLFIARRGLMSGKNRPSAERAWTEIRRHTDFKNSDHVIGFRERGTRSSSIHARRAHALRVFALISPNPFDLPARFCYLQTFKPPERLKEEARCCTDYFRLR